MYDFLNGKVDSLSPAIAVMNCGGVGYEVNITLPTFEHLKGKENAIIFVHLSIREDAHVLFGFSSRAEREVFRQLISVSGVGPATGRLILSSVSVNELTTAISRGDISLLRSVKGIGPKTAQRLLVELQDKFGKRSITDEVQIGHHDTDSAREALTALVTLGFPRQKCEKVIFDIKSTNGELSSEEFIKIALQKL